MLIFNNLRTFVASREGKGNAEVRPPAYLEELRHNACLENIPSWSGMRSTPSECAACFYLDDLKTLVNHIEASFSDLRNFIDENY